MTRHEQAARLNHIPIDFVAWHTGLKLETILKKVRSMENPDTVKAGKSGNGVSSILGLLPTEGTEKHFPGVVEAWLREQQLAQAREEREATGDLVELGDALPELVERCARLRAVADRDRRAARLALAQEWGVSEPTLNRWIREAVKKRKGPAALKHKERLDKGKLKKCPDVIKQYLVLQITDGRKLSLRRRLKDAKKECLRLGINPAVLSYTTARRIKEGIGAATRAFHGSQKQLYKDGFQPHALVEKPERPNEVWTIDHFRFDNFLFNPTKRDLRGKIVGGPDRPWLSAIRDEGTNYLVGWHISWQGNSSTLALTLHNAFSRHTPPKFLKRDRGKDMLGTQVTAILQDNQVEPINVEGRHGQAKGIERTFGVIASDFCPQFGDWCGNSSASKPDQIEVTRTLEEFTTAFGEWLREYHATPSRALRNKSPNQVLRDHYESGFRESPLEKGALRILLMRSKPRQVWQFGIQLWSVNGEPLIYQHKDLHGLIGKKVEVFWHPDCIGEAHVYQRDGGGLKFVCTALNPPLLRIGATQEDLKKAVYTPRKEAREIHKAFKAEAERKYKSGLELIGDAARERLGVPEPEELPLAVNAGIPRISRFSHMAREQAKARKSLVAVEVDPEQALADMAQQTRGEELEQINRSYKKSMRLLELFDDQS